MRELQERFLKHPSHLVRRFFGYLRARPLRPPEQQWVHDQLASADLRALFFAQPHQDQRHAFEVATRAGGGRARTEAALLHDVGKADVPLGAIGRSLATLWAATSLPGPEAWSVYAAHGERGAARLAAVEASHLAVSFARNHPGPPPAGVDAEDWRALEHADDV